MPPNLECLECGAEARSKCPYCRTVFPVNQVETQISYYLKRRIEKDDRDENWLHVELCMGNGTEKDNLTWGLEQLHKILHDMATERGIPGTDIKNPSLKQYACDHQWRFKKGEKSTIGCGHKGRR